MRRYSLSYAILFILFIIRLFLDTDFTDYTVFIDGVKK